MQHKPFTIPPLFQNVIKIIFTCKMFHPYKVIFRQVFTNWNCRTAQVHTSMHPLLLHIVVHTVSLFHLLQDLLTIYRFLGAILQKDFILSILSLPWSSPPDMTKLPTLLFLLKGEYNKNFLCFQSSPHPSKNQYYVFAWLHVQYWTTVFRLSGSSPVCETHIVLSSIISPSCCHHTATVLCDSSLTFYITW